MSDWDDTGIILPDGDETNKIGEERERGLYINDKLVSSIQMDGKSVTKITDENGKVLWEYFNDYFYVQNENALMNTLTLTKTGTPTATDLQYKLDNGNLKGTWKDVTFSDDNKFQIMMAIRGSRVSFRSTTGFSSSSSDYFTIKCANQFSVGGNILSLVNYKNTKYIDTLPDYCFTQMFSSALSLQKLNIDLGNVTTVGDGSFKHFCYNSSVTDVSFKNVIETIGNDGFKNCFDMSKLTTAPDFSTVTSVGQNGFNCCFEGTAITTAPDFRNVTSVRPGAFSSCFSRCKNLTEAYAPSVSSWSYSNFSSWLYGVAETGTLYADKSMEGKILMNSTNGCPSGWTIVYTD